MMGYSPIVQQKIASIKGYLSVIENYTDDITTYRDALKSIRDISEELLNKRTNLYWVQEIPDKAGIYYFSALKQDVDIPKLVGVSLGEGTDFKSKKIRSIQATKLLYQNTYSIFSIIQELNLKTNNTLYYFYDVYDNLIFTEKSLIKHPLSECWFAGPIERPPRTIE